MPEHAEERPVPGLYAPKMKENGAHSDEREKLTLDRLGNSTEQIQELCPVLWGCHGVFDEREQLFAYAGHQLFGTEVLKYLLGFGHRGSSWRRLSSIAVIMAFASALSMSFSQLSSVLLISVVSTLSASDFLMILPFGLLFGLFWLFAPPWR